MATKIRLLKSGKKNNHFIESLACSLEIFLIRIKIWWIEKSATSLISLAVAATIIY